MKKKSDFKYYVFVSIIVTIAIVCTVIGIRADIEAKRNPKVLTQEELKKQEEEHNERAFYYLTVIRPLLGL